MTDGTRKKTKKELRNKVVGTAAVEMNEARKG